MDKLQDKLHPPSFVNFRCSTSYLEEISRYCDSWNPVDCLPCDFAIAGVDAMLMLLFHIENARYALESRYVEAVLPRLELQKLPPTRAEIAGFIQEQDSIIPVIEFGQLTQQRSCRAYLSTRIILIQYPQPDRPPYRFGLLAERVTQTLDSSEIKLTQPNPNQHHLAFLDPLIADDQGLIQCVQIEPLIATLQAMAPLLLPHPLPVA